MSMDINAKKGQRVKYMHPRNGYEGDQEKAKKHLKLGNEYTIESTDMGDYRTEVYLKEVPGVPFNSVMFEDITKKKKPE